MTTPSAAPRRAAALFTLVVPALVVAAAPLAAQPAGDLAAYAERIDALAQPLIDNQLVVGMTVGVARGDQTLIRGYGTTANPNHPIPDGDTVYEIGSITKTFTATLLADMVARGEVALDDPITKYLPDGVKPPPDGGESITLAHLAMHTSGLPRMPSNFAPANPANPYADYDADRMWAFLSRAPLQRRPGERYDYSNLGAGLLGTLLARRAGTTYERLLADRIIGPVGMQDTAITFTPAMRDRLAPGHAAVGTPAANWDLDALAGAGAIRSTVNDMLRYGRANLDASDGPLGGAPALTFERRADAGGGRSVGLGWHIAPDGVTRWHNGGTGGYHTMTTVARPSKTVVVVLANTQASQIDQLAVQIGQLLAGDDVEPMPIRERVAVDPAVLRRYVGRYPIVPNFVLTVTLEGDQLMVQATNQQKLPVYPMSETAFFYRVVEARIEFQVDDAGNVTGLVLHQNGRQMPASRAP